MDRVRIINFHGVGKPQRELDPGEQPFWLTRENFCAVLDRLVELGSRHNFKITFDDGNSSDLVIAVPELVQRGLKATFFVITARLDQPGSLSSSNLEALAGSGMQLGSHGVGHFDLRALDSAALRFDLEQSKSVIESATGTPVRTFAIPFGRYNGAALRAIEKAGYSHAYTSDGGDADPTAFLQPRRSLRDDMSATEVEHLLTGQVPMARRIRRSVAMTFKRFA